MYAAPHGLGGANDKLFLACLQQPYYACLRCTSALVVAVSAEIEGANKAHPPYRDDTLIAVGAAALHQTIAQA